MSAGLNNESLRRDLTAHLKNQLNAPVSPEKMTPGSIMKKVRELKASKQDVVADDDTIAQSSGTDTMLSAPVISELKRPKNKKTKASRNANLIKRKAERILKYLRESFGMTDTVFDGELKVSIVSNGITIESTNNSDFHLEEMALLQKELGCQKTHKNNGGVFLDTEKASDLAEDIHSRNKQAKIIKNYLRKVLLIEDSLLGDALNVSPVFGGIAITLMDLHSPEVIEENSNNHLIMEWLQKTMEWLQKTFHCTKLGEDAVLLNQEQATKLVERLKNKQFQLQQNTPQKEESVEKKTEEAQPPENSSHSSPAPENKPPKNKLRKSKFPKNKPQENKPTLLAFIKEIKKLVDDKNLNREANYSLFGGVPRHVKYLRKELHRLLLLPNEYEQQNLFKEIKMTIASALKTKPTFGRNPAVKNLYEQVTRAPDFGESEPTYSINHSK